MMDEFLKMYESQMKRLLERISELEQRLDDIEIKETNDDK